MDFFAWQRQQADARWEWNKTYRCLWLVAFVMLAQVLIYGEGVWLATVGFAVMMLNDIRRGFSDRRFYRDLEMRRQGYLAGHKRGLDYVQELYRPQ